MSKKEKYTRLLREGKTEEATELVSSSETEVSTSEVEDSESSVQGFEDLKGVGDELAVELREEFGEVENLKDASASDLEPIPGIGEKRAESLLEQV